MRTLFGFLLLTAFLGACAQDRPRKYDKQHLQAQKQEAIDMINKMDPEDEIKIKRSMWGDDKIILEDN